jgi:2-polyprenyl-3-methyl-5-hydroxy-6-metoxy-1,4-benzoquinol methylase
MTTATDAMTCWVCRSSRHSLFHESGIDRDLSSADMRVTDSRYGTTVRLYRCDDCGFIFADMAQVKTLVALYAGLQDPDYEAGAAVRSLQMAKIVDAILRLRPGAKTLLDIGAGIGLMVKEAKKRGLAAEGIEPSEWAVSVGKEKLGANLHAGIFPHPATDGKKYDVITLVDVIEHVDDPVGLMTSIRKQLAPGGLAVIVTPDVASIAARMLGRRWWHYRLAHVGFFDDATMRKALDRAGLKVERRRRAKWYFTVGYLADRMAVYVPPLKWVNRIVAGGFVYRGTVPLNLFDSWCYYVTGEE